MNPSYEYRSQHPGALSFNRSGREGTLTRKAIYSLYKPVIVPFTEPEQLWFLLIAKNSLEVLNHIRDLVDAALNADYTLLAVFDHHGIRLKDSQSLTVVELCCVKIATSTIRHGNPLLSALTDIVGAMSGLKVAHSEAYTAVTERLRQIVEPQYWSELLD